MKSPHSILSALGMVNGLGVDTETVWARLMAGDQGGLALRDDIVPGKSVRVGRVPVNDADVEFPNFLAPYRCRNNALILLAFDQIKDRVQKSISHYGADRVGVVMGSSTSGVSATEAAFAGQRANGRFPSGFFYVQHELGGVAEFLAKLAGVRGPAYTISTACSSSAKAFVSARALVRDGWCDAVLVGGADSLCRLTVEGFKSLEALSERPSNSMSLNRDGFNVGEGAALFLLEKGTEGIELLGVGESSDAYHMSAPQPDGEGALSSMGRALEDAGINAGDIGYINLHGTATVLNDQMEARAVSALFPQTPASSTKAMTGHTLGAAGAMEVGICWLSLVHAQQGRAPLPPHCWDGHTASDLPTLSLVPLGTKEGASEGSAFLSNSFGFGGSNCSVIIRDLHGQDTRATTAFAGAVKVTGWAGWLPGVFTKEEWARYFADPSKNALGPDPLVPELPALMRRRMGRISKMSAAVAFSCCRERGVSARDVPLVFASRHGEMGALMGLLSQMADGEPVSPTAFSHSVHHTAGSYFSMAAGNKKELRSVAGGPATFSYGFLDAVGLLNERGNTEVLLLVADETVPPLFEHLVNETRIPYAVGILLSRVLDGPGVTVGFDFAPSVGIEPMNSVQALDFIRWLTGSESRYSSDRGGLRWTWSKK